MQKESRMFTKKLLLRRFQKFDFLGLKNLFPGQFLGSTDSPRYH